MRGIPRPECFPPSLSHDPFKNISGFKIFRINLYKSKMFFRSFHLIEIEFVFQFHQCLRIFFKYLSLYPTITVHWMVHQLSTYFKDQYSSWQILGACSLVFKTLCSDSAECRNKSGGSGRPNLNMCLLFPYYKYVILKMSVPKMSFNIRFMLPYKIINL